MSRVLLHYYLNQIKEQPRRDEITGVLFYLEGEVPALIGRLEAYRGRTRRRGPSPA